jgi:hypothetical protein
MLVCGGGVGEREREEPDISKGITSDNSDFEETLVQCACSYHFVALAVFTCLAFDNLALPELFWDILRVLPKQTKEPSGVYHDRTTFGSTAAIRAGAEPFALSGPRRSRKGQRMMRNPSGLLCGTMRVCGISTPSYVERWNQTGGRGRRPSLRAKSSARRPLKSDQQRCFNNMPSTRKATHPNCVPKWKISGLDWFDSSWAPPSLAENRTDHWILKAIPRWWPSDQPVRPCSNCTQTHPRPRERIRWHRGLPFARPVPTAEPDF